MRPQTARCNGALLLAAACLLAVAPGCSDDSVGPSLQDPGGSVGDATSLTGGKPGAGDASVDTAAPKPPAEIATIETIASPEHVQAGLDVTVTCAALDKDLEVIEGVAMTTFVSGPGPYHMHDSSVSFEKVGTYEAVCKTDDGLHEDDTPEQIEVAPGDGVVVETTLSAHEVTAGDKVDVSCEIHDAFGNLNEDASTEIWAKPGTGWAAFGMTMKTLTAGKYDVACRLKDSGLTDETPEVLVVAPGLPRKILTLLEPDTIEAGGSSKVTCVAVDAYDNPVGAFPMSLKIPEALTLQGLSLTTVVSGNYGVKCVPETDPWELYEIQEAVLHVMPGPPSQLYVQQVPAKPVYKKNDTLELVVQVLDEFMNVIPDAALQPITITPDVGVKVVNPKTFSFKEEGKFIFHLEVVDYPEVSEDLAILVDGQGPVLVIEKPARAATLTGKPAVNIEGHVSDEIAGVTSLTINGAPVAVKADGTFTHIMLATQGMNPVVAEAMDLGGKVSHTTRAFTYSMDWYPIDAATPDVGRVPSGFEVWLGKGFLDDGNHDPAHPDDLATILETFIGNLDLGNLVPSPAASTGPYKLYLKNLKFDKPTLSLVPFDGGLKTKVTIPNLYVKVELIGKCKVLFVDLCPDVKGSVTAKSIKLDASVLAKSENGAPVVSVAGVDVALDGLDINIDGILGWLIDWLVDWLVDSFTGQIEKAFEGQIGGMLSGTISDLLTSFALNQAIEIPPLLLGTDPATLQLGTKISLIEFSPEGGLIGMDANIITTKKVAQDPLGSIGRANCLKAKPQVFEVDKSQEIGIALHDDVINQALFSVWFSALLNGQVDPAMLGSMGSLEDYGVSDLQITTLLFGAPLLTSCNPGEQLKAQVPDAYVEVSLSLAGIPLEMGLFVTIEVEASLVLVEDATDKKIGVEIGGISLFNMEIVSITPGWEESIPDLEVLFKEQLLGGLAGQLEGQQLGAFPIPEIDLSTLDPSIPPGTMLNLELNDLVREGGYTAINGQVK